MAVHRRAPGEGVKEAFFPSEGLEAETALRLSTIAAARMIGVDRLVGSIRSVWILNGNNGKNSILKISSCKLCFSQINLAQAYVVGRDIRYMYDLACCCQAQVMLHAHI